MADVAVPIRFATRHGYALAHAFIADAFAGKRHAVPSAATGTIIPFTHPKGASCTSCPSRNRSSIAWSPSAAANIASRISRRPRPRWWSSTCRTPSCCRASRTPCPMAEKIVPNINRLAGAVREAGGTVIWIKTTFKDDALENWSTYFEMAAAAGRQAHRRAHRRQQGPRALATLDVRPDDLIVEKNRFSAFIQGSSNLAEVLRARGLDTPSPAR